MANDAQSKDPKLDKFPRPTWFAIEKAEADREDAVRKYLTRCGWEYTCRGTRSLWLWQKILTDGRTILCNESTAIHFQQNEDALTLEPAEDLCDG